MSDELGIQHSAFSKRTRLRWITAAETTRMSLSEFGSRHFLVGDIQMLANIFPKLIVGAIIIILLSLVLKP